MALIVSYLMTKSSFTSPWQEKHHFKREIPQAQLYSIVDCHSLTGLDKKQVSFPLNL